MNSHPLRCSIRLVKDRNMNYIRSRRRRNAAPWNSRASNTCRRADGAGGGQLAGCGMAGRRRRRGGDDAAEWPAWRNGRKRCGATGKAAEPASRRFFRMTSPAARILLPQCNAAAVSAAQTKKVKIWSCIPDFHPCLRDLLPPPRDSLGDKLLHAVEKHLRRLGGVVLRQTSPCVDSIGGSRGRRQVRPLHRLPLSRDT